MIDQPALRRILAPRRPFLSKLPRLIAGEKPSCLISIIPDRHTRLTGVLGSSFPHIPPSGRIAAAPPDLIALVDIEGRDRLNPRLRIPERVYMQPARCGGFVRNYGSPPVLAPHLRALSGYVYYILCGFPFLYFHFLIVLYNKGQFSPIKVAEYIVIRYFLK